MARALAAASLLILCGGVAAGCGGLSPQDAGRRDARQLFGDPRAQVVAVETFTNLSGTSEAVVTMKGNFSHWSYSPVRCSAAPCHQVRYIALNFLLPPGPATSAGFQTLTASMIAATAHARSANPLFKLFPDIGAPAIRCAIPRGGHSPGTIAGGCLTQIESQPSSHVTRVTFIEHWPFVRKRNGSWPSYEKSATWIVTLSQSGRVQSIRLKGKPPQLWG